MLDGHRKVVAIDERDIVVGLVGIALKGEFCKRRRWNALSFSRTGQLFASKPQCLEHDSYRAGTRDGASTVTRQTSFPRSIDPTRLSWRRAIIIETAIRASPNTPLPIRADGLCLVLSWTQQEAIRLGARSSLR